MGGSDTTWVDLTVVERRAHLLGLRCRNFGRTVLPTVLEAACRLPLQPNVQRESVFTPYIWCIVAI